MSLDLDLGSSSLGLPLLLGIRLDSSEEVLTRTAVSNVLLADVDALLNVSVADLLVEDDADGGLGYVVDDTGLSMVELVWHTLLNRTVGDDIDNVTDSEDRLAPCQSFTARWLDKPVLLEVG